MPETHTEITPSSGWGRTPGRRPLGFDGAVDATTGGDQGSASTMTAPINGLDFVSFHRSDCQAVLGSDSNPQVGFGIPIDFVDVWNTHFVRNKFGNPRSRVQTKRRGVHAQMWSALTHLQVDFESLSGSLSQFERFGHGELYNPNPSVQTCPPWPPRWSPVSFVGQCPQGCTQRPGHPSPSPPPATRCVYHLSQHLPLCLTR